MPVTTTRRQRLVDDTYERLHALVTDPSRNVGDQLQPIRELSAQFGVSLPTVQRAMARLEEEGLIERRHGAGTFIAAQDRPLGFDQSITLCMSVHADLFGYLASSLTARLQERGLFVNLIDCAHFSGEQLLRGMSQTAAWCLVVHGQLHFPFHVFEDPRFRRKHVIGVVVWESDLDMPELTRILCDYSSGAEMLIEHLWELGHRRILVLGTVLQLELARHRASPRISRLSYGMVNGWEARGGKVDVLASLETGGFPAFDLRSWQDLFAEPDHPTAIVGLRDAEALAAQHLLDEHFPELGERLGIVSYYNTKWSQVGRPPITSVDLNLDAVMAATVERVEALLAGTTEPQSTPILIPPRLEIRSTSRPLSALV